MIEFDHYHLAGGRLDDSEQSLARVVESSTDGLIIVAEDGRMTFANAAA